MKVLTYEEGKKYLENLIKPFQMEKIVGVPREYNNPLGRMTYLLELLDNPQKKFQSIVVSGTSGKGSTAYLLARILTTAGYKTGLTISPHLVKINERMQIGQDNELKFISDTKLISLLSTIIPEIEKMARIPLGPPSYFEALLAITFLYFAQEKVEIAVVEVGFEGKYDGTQVLKPLLFLYTNTSLDHTAILGNTLEQVAHEGVSVIEKDRDEKERLIVVSGVKQPKIQRIVQRVCNDYHASLFLMSKDFSYVLKNMTLHGEKFDFVNSETFIHNIHLSLIGEYQVENASLAIEAIFQLRKFGFHVSELLLKQALKIAFFPGRFEIMGNIILDGAHNPAKMWSFLKSVNFLYPDRKKIFIIGFKKDKDILEMLQYIYEIADEIIITSYYVTTDLDKNNALSTHGLLDKIQKIHQKKVVYTAGNVDDAISKAKKKSHRKDLIIITGSLYLVGEAKKVLMG